jgi:hypothetical protein
MKKALVAIILICYLAVSCGVVINFHYCMDQLSSTRLFASESKICNKCGMHSQKNHGCCRDEVKILRMKTDQQKVRVIQLSNFPSTIASITSTFIVIPSYNTDPSNQWQGHSPPLLITQDTYLQNCVFTI